jgi:hypothetical protein
MGNTISKQKPNDIISNSCKNYKHNNIVTAIYTVLSEYQIEALCECASWLLRYILIQYKQYSEHDVDLISGRVNDTYHVWVYDKTEKYYIDITSEQFSDNSKCFCTQNIDDFYKLGYKITNEMSTDEISKSIANEPFILYDNDKEITLSYLLHKIKQKLKIGGRTRYRKKNNKINK